MMLAFNLSGLGSLKGPLALVYFSSFVFLFRIEGFIPRLAEERQLVIEMFNRALCFDSCLLEVVLRRTQSVQLFSYSLLFCKSLVFSSSCLMISFSFGHFYLFISFFKFLIMAFF